MDEGSLLQFIADISDPTDVVDNMMMMMLILVLMLVLLCPGAGGEPEGDPGHGPADGDPPGPEREAL